MNGTGSKNYKADSLKDCYGHSAASNKLAASGSIAPCDVSKNKRHCGERIVSFHCRQARVSQLLASTRYAAQGAPFWTPPACFFCVKERTCDEQDSIQSNHIGEINRSPS